MVDQYWRVCGPCKKKIEFSAAYYRCSVSSCKKQVFCSRECWSAHVPMMRHKDSWYEEEVSPSVEDCNKTNESQPQVRRKVSSGSAVPSTSDASVRDILIVASKLKNYIKTTSDLSTSAQVMEVLSDIVRSHCDRAIIKARNAGRKTLLDRDFDRD